MSLKQWKSDWQHNIEVKEQKGLQHSFKHSKQQENVANRSHSFKHSKQQANVANRSHSFKHSKQQAIVANRSHAKTVINYRVGMLLLNNGNKNTTEMKASLVIIQQTKNSKVNKVIYFGCPTNRGPYCFIHIKSNLWTKASDRTWINFKMHARVCMFLYNVCPASNCHNFMYL